MSSGLQSPPGMDEENPHGDRTGKKQLRRSAGAIAPTTDGAPGGLDKRQLYAALTALKQGDFSVRLPADLSGLDRSVAEAFNDVVELNQLMADELERVCRVVGKEGRISQRASIGHVSGA